MAAGAVLVESSVNQRPLRALETTTSIRAFAEVAAYLIISYRNLHGVVSRVSVRCANMWDVLR